MHHREMTKQPTGRTQKKKKPQAAKAKNPAAVALGRLGGLKGGSALAAKMTPKQRSLSAKKAALARWSQFRTKDAKENS